MDQVLIKESRLENHMDRCRCCLKKFEADSQTVQLTILIEKLFYDFTQIELKNSEKYSNIICINCKRDLIYFSDFKRLLTAKQLKIYEFVEDRDECFKYKLKDHHQEIIQPHLDFEITVEEYIKTEQETDTFKATLVVDTFKWPELKTELNGQRPFNEQISNQNFVRRKTGRSKRGRQEYFCEICKIFVEDASRYKLHYERFHLKIKNNFCDKCEYSACSKAEVLSHLKYMHFPKKQKKFTCNLCNKVLATSAYLRFHIKMIHNKNTSHCCEVCGLGFQRNVNLQRHMQRVHDKVTDFKCNEPGCDKAYYSKQELRTHNAAIHNNVPCEIKCKYCDKLYNSELSFSRHLKSHIDPQWGCDLCSEKFFKKGLLTDHKRSRHWDD